MWKVINGLYLGTRADSEDFHILQSQRISHMVNCAAELPSHFETNIEYLELRLSDPDHRLGIQLDQVCAFIDRGRDRGAVLVHCSGAISRGPSVILAYLCHCGLQLEQAADQLGQIVPTRPNEIFLSQLCHHFGWPADADRLSALTQALGRMDPGIAP